VVEIQCLKKEIQRTGVTQENVAHMIGVTLGTVHRWLKDGKFPTSQPVVEKVKEVTRKLSKLPEVEKKR
jgi:predicted site-specific integrase-resolvase